MHPLATTLFVLSAIILIARVAAGFHKGACCDHGEYVDTAQFECGCGCCIKAPLEDIE